MPHISPLPISSPLAPTPRKDPEFAVSVKLANGRALKVADPATVRALVALMNTNAVIGGAACHYGGPAALAELNSALYGIVFQTALDADQEWFELFHLVNDAGHTENGLYALKAAYGFADLNLAQLKSFRSMTSVLTGHGESHLFPQGVYLSNGPLGSSLPQAQGLAMADALAGRSRVTITTISDGACMEGEAKEAFSAIPGFAARGQLAPFIMVISDNDTKLTGRITKDSFSMEPTFKSLTALGWNVIQLENGHDLQACVSTLEKAIQDVRANPKQPIAIHARTIKGKGVKKTEESASGGHGFPLKDASEIRSFVSEILGDQTCPSELQAWIEELEKTLERKPDVAASASQKETAAPVKTEKIQVGVSQALIKARQRGLPVISVTSDLPGSTGLAEFRKACPEGNFDVGVAESNMVSAAIGLSKSGYIPVVDTFAQFGVTKGALPLIMGSLSDGPIISIFSHTGFQDAADGASHQALSYFAMVAAIPHVKVIALTCRDEAEALVTQAIDQFASARRQGKPVPHYIFFLGRENFPAYYGDANTKYELGRAQVIQMAGIPDWKLAKGPALTIAAAGSLLPEAIKAQRELQQLGITALVVNPSSINHPDIPTFKAVLEKTQGCLLTVEDHQVIAGFGAQLTHALLQARVPLTNVQSLGVKDAFGRSAYKASDLYAAHNLDARAIIQTAREMVLNK